MSTEEQRNLEADTENPIMTAEQLAAQAEEAARIAAETEAATARANATTAATGTQPPATRTAARTVQDVVNSIIVPPEPAAETDAVKNARQERLRAGTATEEDKQRIAEEAAYNNALQARTLRTDYYRKWNFVAGASTVKVNPYTSYDANGRLITPAAGTTPGPGHAMLPYYVSETESNLLNAPIGVIDACDMLSKINGEDCYSNEAAALGRVTEREYLVLPQGVPIPTVPLADVGTSRAKNYFSPVFLMAVYVLNKNACADNTGNNNAKYGLLRMEAVKIGWYDAQREVKLEVVPTDFLQVAAADSALFKEHLEAAKDAAWLVPFASEHTFRTKGHHYITGLKSEYIAAYETIFRASLLPNAGNFLPADLLYHSALHWVSPKRVWEVLKEHGNTPRIPDAIKLRMTSAPAGTALITTTAAALEAFDAAGYLEEMKQSSTTDVAIIFDQDKVIRADPPQYHRTPVAYGKSALDVNKQKALDKAKDEAKKIAPILQAFCDTTLRRAPLGRQKVLTKHAEDNPTLRIAARRFFQEVGKERPKSLAEVLGKRKERPDGGASDAT